MTFTDFVSKSTAISACMNYGEHSYMITISSDEFVFGYHGQVETRNIVVVERIKFVNNQINPDDVRYYFKAFDGKHSGQCETEEEAKSFYEIVGKIHLDESNRVNPKDLEALILAQSQIYPEQIH